jgi:hypothetical protein
MGKREAANQINKDNPDADEDEPDYADSTGADISARRIVKVRRRTANADSSGSDKPERPNPFAAVNAGPSLATSSPFSRPNSMPPITQTSFPSGGTSPSASDEKTFHRLNRDLVTALNAMLENDKWATADWSPCLRKYFEHAEQIRTTLQKVPVRCIA